MTGEDILKNLFEITGDDGAVVTLSPGPLNIMADKLDAQAARLIFAIDGEQNNENAIADLLTMFFGLVVEEIKGKNGEPLAGPPSTKEIIHGLLLNDDRAWVILNAIWWIRFLLSVKNADAPRL